MIYFQGGENGKSRQVNQCLKNQLQFSSLQQQSCCTCNDFEPSEEEEEEEKEEKEEEEDKEEEEEKEVSCAGLICDCSMNRKAII